MNSLKEKDRQKMVQDRCQNLLNTMLRDEDNKYCVDCDAKGPRWASWNLGIFLCIRCAGIHRNLGVHISKVKSVNLDTWTPEQVMSLEQMGNSRARAVYEANLPDSFRRPQADSALESFIRAKYETKKYIAQEWVPPPLPKVNWDKEIEEEIQRTRRQRRETKTSTTVTVPKKVESVIPQPLPKPSPKLQRSTDRIVGASNPPNNAPSPSPKSTATTDLLGLDTPVSESGQEDIFSSFLSAEAVTVPTTVASVEPKRTDEEEQFFKQSATSLNAAQDKKMSTDSILALYSKSTPSQPNMAYPQPNVFQTYQPNGVIPPNNVPSLSSNPFYSLAASGNQMAGHFPVQPPNMGVGVSSSSGFNTHQLSAQLPTTSQTGTLSSNLWH